MKVFIKILKIIAGIILGLAFSLVTIVCLEILLPKPNPFRRPGFNLRLVGPIIAGWLFLVLWFLLRKPSSKKIQTNGIELLPQSIGELIDAIISAMKYRRSVRAEVRQELTDHFTDALADCEDEQEKVKCVKELIEEFGDIELLGKLLRRAKKRCRPLWRTMVVRFFQLIGICFVLLIIYIGWFFTGKPQITTNYLEVMNQQVRPVADDSQNAWPFYKQAAGKRVEYEDKDFDFHPINPSPFTRSEQDKEIIRESISNNQQSLDLIRQGNQKPYYWRVYDNEEHREDNEMLSVLIPNLADYKKLAYLMCWQGLLSAERGDFEKAFGDLLETYSFGQHLRGQNATIIEQLVAMGIEWISTDTLRMVLYKYDEQIDVQILNRVRKQFGAMIADKDFSMDFASEVLFMRDEAQRCFTQSRFGRSHLYLPRLNELGALEIDKLNIGDKDDVLMWLKSGLLVLFAHPDKEQTLKDVERFYSEMDKFSDLTPASAKAQGFDMDEFAEKTMEKNVLLGVLMPAITKLITYSHRSRVDAEATLVILAILQYEKEHGEYPQSLDVLAGKGLLNKVPIDPFSDKPLVYHKADNGFLLYSIGYNFTDDGGVLGGYKRSSKNRSARCWTENGDAVFWPVE